MLKRFAHDLSALTAAKLCGLNKNTTHRIYSLLRQRVMVLARVQAKSLVRGIVEVDESYYIQRFADELNELTFEPEKSFETLVEYSDKDGGALVSGAIDIVRRDDPPRVTLVDFKSGDPESDKHNEVG